MIGIGIDIGSTAAKAAVVDGEGSVAWTCVQPTGFSSVDASERLREALAAAGYDVTADDVRVIATGYGRVAVPYAHKVVTEITCHGTGAVAGNLGHDLVRIGHGDTTVAGRDHTHVVGRHVIAGRCQCLAQPLGSIDRGEPGWLHARPRHRTLPVDHSSLSRRRPDIDPDPYHGSLPI